MIKWNGKVINYSYNPQGKVTLVTWDVYKKSGFYNSTIYYMKIRD